MRKKAQPFRGQRWMIWVGPGFALGIVGLFFLLPLAVFGEDFSRAAPESIYRMVFRETVPPGISDLRASGRHYLTKRWVWLRFHVTDAAVINRLTGDDPFPHDQAAVALHHSLSANGHYDAQDEQKVGWEEVRRLSNPEVYQFSSGDALKGEVYQKDDPDSQWLWSGFVVVDRKTNTVYVHALGD